jgi:hypothetical protein
MSYTPPPTSVVSAANSSVVPLATSGVFTGTSVDITQYSSVTVQVFADVASATDGLSIQQSVNGTNWDNIDAYSIPAATGKTFGVQTTGQFLRVVYTNGATAQATFRLQTILHSTASNSSSVRPQDGRTNDNDMQESIGYNMLFNGTVWNRALLGSQLSAASQAVVLASDQSPISTKDIYNSTAFSITTVTNSATQDVSGTGYSYVSVQVTTQGTTSTVTFQTSNDGTNWVSQALQAATSTGAGSTTTTTATGLYAGAVFGRYFRIAVTGITAGTTAGTILLTREPINQTSIGVGGTVTANSVGAAADNAAVSGNPIRLGVQARITNPTAKTDAFTANLISDKLGKLIAVGSIRDLKGRQATTLTSTTTETTIVTAGAAGVFNDVYGLIIANTSATTCTVTIRDVTAAGTPISFQVPPNDTRGFMLPEGAALKQGTAASAWTATCGTSVASIQVTALFVANI